MAARALIILGLSESMALLPAYRERWPDHEIWTMSRGFIPAASRHLEIHHDRTCNRAAVLAARQAGVPVVIGPHCQPEHPLEAPFPLALIESWFPGAAYELTLDYALAYAALKRAEGHVLFDVLALPGNDCDDTVHYVSRGAAQAWVGYFRWGLGLHVEIPPASALMRRRPDILQQVIPWHAWRGPIYGQPA